VRDYLLIVNAGPRSEPVAPHLGDNVDVLAIHWCPSSRVDVFGAATYRDYDPRHHKFHSAAAFMAWCPVCQTSGPEALLLRKVGGCSTCRGTGRVIDDYRAIALADDDLVPIGCTWTDIFRLMAEAGLSVAQPAIHPSSGNHYSHPITLQVAGVTWRQTDFVEVMCPILTREAFLRTPFSDAGFSAWGLEAWWGAKERCGILDATPVRHTRPVKSGGHAELGINFEDEAETFRQKYGVARPREINFEIRRGTP
jgi:hypothetical protein